MSIIANDHAYVTLDRNTKAQHGQRLSRVIAKADREGKYASEHLQESLAVSVPMVTEEDMVESIAALMPHIRKMLETAQDALIREHRLEAGATSINSAQISVTACIAYLSETSTGTRLTKEYLQEWFVSTYGTVAKEWISTNITHTLTDMHPTKVEEVVTEKVGILAGMVATWASPKASPPIPAIKATLRFVEHCEQVGVVDGILSGLRGKMKVMLEKKTAELSLDALGF